MTCIFGGSVYLNISSTWTAVPSPNLPNNANWTGVACNSTGTIMAACATGGFVYLSSNSGTSWTQQIMLGTKTWQYIIVSPDGSRVVAAVNGGAIFTYLFSTRLWYVENDLPTMADWSALACNADCSLVSASIRGGGIWTFAPNTFMSISI
jgi:hypothetical protein